MTKRQQNPKVWFIVEDADRKGPYSSDDLKELVRLDIVKADTLIWKSGLDQPVRAEKIKGLIASSPPNSSSLEAKEQDPQPAGSKDDTNARSQAAEPSRKSARSTKQKAVSPRPPKEPSSTFGKLAVPALLLLVLAAVAGWYWKFGDHDAARDLFHSAPEVKDRIGFVQGSLSQDQLINELEVVLEIGENTDVREPIDLHLGFGFPLRLSVPANPSFAPVFFAIPTKNSLSKEQQTLKAGQEIRFEFDATNPSELDPLHITKTLLSGLKVGDISQVGFAGNGLDDWRIKGYQILVNGERFASNDMFDLGIKNVNDENSKFVAESLAQRKQIAMTAEDLQTMVEAGLSSEADQSLLDEKSDYLSLIDQRISLIGGQLLGQYPAISEIRLQPSPDGDVEDSVSEVIVKVFVSDQEKAGTKNPIYLQTGAKKFLLTSEVFPLKTQLNEQVFRISNTDLRFSPVSKNQLQKLRVGILGSNEPFAEVPDRATLDRVIVVVNGDIFYDSDQQVSDRRNLSAISFVPERHRDENGEVVTNTLTKFEVASWAPGSGEFPDSKALLPLEEEPASPLPPYRFEETFTEGDDEADAVAPPNVTNVAEDSENPSEPESAERDFDESRPLPESVPPARIFDARLGPSVLVSLLDFLLDELLASRRGSEPDGREELESTDTEGAVTVFPTTSATLPSPGPSPITSEILVEDIELDAASRMFLEAGSRPAIEFRVRGNPRWIQGRLWGVLPHRNFTPFLIADSDKVAFSAGLNSISLPPLTVASLPLAAEEIARMSIRPEITVFDNDDEVASDGIVNFGPLVPLHLAGSRPRLTVGPTLQGFLGFQVDGDGFGPPVATKEWQPLAFSDPGSPSTAWFLLNQFNTRNAFAFDPGRSAVAARTGGVPLSFRYEFRQQMDSDARIIGHLGVLDGLSSSIGKIEVTARLVVQSIPSGKTPHEIAPVSSSSLKQEHEVLRILTTKPVVFDQNAPNSPLMLIDIPISLGDDEIAYQEKLQKFAEDTGLEFAIDPKYAKSLPLGPINDAFVSLTLTIDQANPANPAAGEVALIGMRIADDGFTASGAGTPLPPPASKPIEQIEGLAYNTFLDSARLARMRGARANEIAKSITASHDFVVLSELFDTAVSNSLLKSLTATHPHQTPIVGNFNKNGWAQTTGSYRGSQTGGIAIISRWPIELSEQHIFSTSCGSDVDYNKGFAYARINFNGSRIHVIGTQTQGIDLFPAGSPSCNATPPSGFDFGFEQRRTQFNEIVNFIKDKKIPLNEPLFIAGDFNVNANTQEYKDMLGVLGVKQPAEFFGTNASYDPTQNPWARESTVFKETDGPRLQDFVFVSKNHFPIAGWNNHIIANNFSDHFPVLGTTVKTGGAVTPARSYEVTFRTGTFSDFGLKSAVGGLTTGTNSQVQARFSDKTGTWSEWFTLDNLGPDRRPGSIDKYTISTSVGDFVELEIKKESLGLLPLIDDRWGLLDIEVENNNGKTSSVSVNQLLKDGTHTFKFK